MNRQAQSRVTVRFYATLRDRLGVKEVVVPARSVAGILEELKERLGAPFTAALYQNGRMNNRYIILLRGRRIFREDIQRSIWKMGMCWKFFPRWRGGEKLQETS